MNITYRKAVIADAPRLIQIYNDSFYSDYIRYGECPAYGRTTKDMEESIMKAPKLVIFCDETAVGVISVQHKGEGKYYLGCLCVIPSYQGKGIGTKAIDYLKSYYSDWKQFTLITPADKTENIHFYVDKCGFRVDGTEMDGNVKVAHFVLER